MKNLVQICNRKYSNYDRKVILRARYNCTMDQMWPSATEVDTYVLHDRKDSFFCFVPPPFFCPACDPDIDLSCSLLKDVSVP